MHRDLTKFPPPLIIILVRLFTCTPGVGRTSESPRTVRRENEMKVMIYKEFEGKMAVLVIASPGKGRPPVVLKDLAPGDVKGAVGPVITEMRRPRGAPATQVR